MFAVQAHEPSSIDIADGTELSSDLHMLAMPYTITDRQTLIKHKRILHFYSRIFSDEIFESRSPLSQVLNHSLLTTNVTFCLSK